MKDRQTMQIPVRSPVGVAMPVGTNGTMTISRLKHKAIADALYSYARKDESKIEVQRQYAEELHIQ